MLEEERKRLENAYIPLASGGGDKIYVTQGFGADWQPEKYAKYNMAGHNGIDWGAPHRWYTIAVDKVRVVNRVPIDYGGYGKYIRVVNDAGDQYVHGHLDEVFGKLGQIFERGQPLGRVDNTGDSTGTHIHFGLRPKGFNFSNGFKGYVDPAPR